MSKELYVGNLPFEYGEDELRRLFSVAGTVSYIHLITDPQTGRSKGCAYVKMSSEREAREAIDCLDEARVDNRTLTVSIARPQKPAAPGASPRPGKRPNKAEGPSEPKAAGKGPFKPRGGSSGRGPQGRGR